MTATGAPTAEPVQVRASKLPERQRQPLAIDRLGLRRRLLTMTVLALCMVTVLLAVPDLRPVVREIAAMNPALVGAAVGLELASCFSFVISSGLFFLTSAINVLTLAAAGLLLILGIADGPHDALRAGLPVIAASASVLVLALPRLTRRISREHPRAIWLDDIGTGIPAAAGALARPSWRLLGAIGYLLFDIAVLWTTFAAVGPLPPLSPLVVAYLGAGRA
jgi:hypothetical protein